jgi:hypothetical protein
VAKTIGIDLGTTGGDSKAKKDEGVVDAEYVDVDERKSA